MFSSTVLLVVYGPDYGVAVDVQQPGDSGQVAGHADGGFTGDLARPPRWSPCGLHGSSPSIRSGDAVVVRARRVRWAPAGEASRNDLTRSQRRRRCCCLLRRRRRGLTFFAGAMYEQMLKRRAAAAKTVPIAKDSLIVITDYTDTFLDIEIMSSEQRRELSFSEFQVEMEKYDKTYEFFQVGIKSHTLLRRIGMSTWEMMRRYVAAMNKIGYVNHWNKVAIEYVREKKHELALEVVDEYISETHENYVRESVFDMMICQCLEDGDLNKAISYLAKAFSYHGNPYYFMTSLNNILSFGENKNDFSVGIDLLRKGIVDHEVVRIIVIVRLIKKQIERE